MGGLERDLNLVHFDGSLVYLEFYVSYEIYVILK